MFFIKEDTVMKRGKRICNTLKEVRMKVAKANDIKYAPTECHHEGDCAGTCPACEAEVRYLEQQLQLRRQLGKAVAVVGVSMGLVALASCGSKATDQTAGEIEIAPDTLPITSQSIDPKMAASDSITDTLSTFDVIKREIRDTYLIEIQPVGKVEPPDTVSDAPSVSEPEQADSVASGL